MKVIHIPENASVLLDDEATGHLLEGSVITFWVTP